MRIIVLLLANLLFASLITSAQRAGSLQRVGGIVGGISKPDTTPDYECMGIPYPKFRIDQILTNGFITTRVYYFGRDYEMSKEILAFIECDSSKLCLKDRWWQKAIDCGIANINGQQMHYLKIAPDDAISSTNKTTTVKTNQIQKSAPPVFRGMKNTDTFRKHKKLGQ